MSRKPRLPEVSLGNLHVAGAQVLLRQLDSAWDRHDGVEIRCVLDIRRVQDGEAGEVVTREILTPDAALEPGLLATAIRGCVRKAFLHEIDEWLRIDGQLVCEPHPEPPDRKK